MRGGPVVVLGVEHSATVLCPAGKHPGTIICFAGCVRRMRGEKHLSRVCVCVAEAFTLHFNCHHLSAITLLSSMIKIFTF